MVKNIPVVAIEQDSDSKETAKIKVHSRKLGKDIEVRLVPDDVPPELKKNIGMSNDGGGGVHV